MSNVASALKPDAVGRPEPLSRAVALLAGLKFLAHMATAGNYPFHRDELYYLVCGRHPAWGYPDQPPLTPWLSAVSEHLFGLSPWGLRLWPALAGATIVLLAGWLASRFGGGRLAQLLAALAVALAPVYLVSGSLMQTVVLDQLFWVASAAVLVAVINGASPRLLVVFALVLGLGLWAKLTILVWGAGLLAGLLLTRDRRLLGGRWIWLGAAIAAGCAVPIVRWQLDHGRPLLEFLANNRADDELSSSGFLRSQIGMSGPIAGTVLLLAGFVFLLGSRAGRRWRSLGIAIAVAWAIFLVTGGKPYYAGPTYPMLFAGGAVLVERLLARRRSRVWGRVAVGLLASHVVMTPLSLPIIPARHLGAIMDRLPNDDWANMFGWQEIAGQIADACKALTPAESAGLRILAPNYGVAGAIDVYGAALGMAPALSGHNAYTFWESAPALDPLVFIGYDAAWLGQMYSETRTLGALAGADLGPPDEKGLGIIYCRGLKVAPSALWGDLRHFD